jgi:hypothetical protein
MTARSARSVPLAEAFEIRDAELADVGHEYLRGYLVLILLCKYHMLGMLQLVCPGAKRMAGEAGDLSLIPQHDHAVSRSGYAVSEGHAVNESD